MTSEVTKKSTFKKKWSPTFEITKAQSAPLRRIVGDLDIQRALDKFGKELLRQVRKGVQQAAFSERARKRLAKALQIKLLPNSLSLTARDPLWGYLVNGRKQQQMKWLQKSPTPIPIVTETGELIFRSATAKSMKNGGWLYPGRPALNIAELAKKEARALVQKHLKKEIVTQLRQTTG